MGCHALLQGIFPIQGLNRHLLHCREIFYPLSHQGSPCLMVNGLNHGTWFLCDTLIRTVEVHKGRVDPCCFSVAQWCLTFCKPMDCNTSGLSVPHQFLKFAQVHVHCITDAIQPSHPLTPSSPSAFNVFQHQGLFQ